MSGIILVLAMLTCVLFAYGVGVACGYGWGKAEKWIDGRMTKQAHDRIRVVSGRLAAGINDDYDLGYSEGVTDADLLNLKRRDQTEGGRT